MYGITIAFKNFSMRKGILGSPWIGFENFERLFSSYWFPTILRNTLTISLLSLVISFPFPILIALMVNELENKTASKVFQTVSYAPHFISTIVLCGMVVLFLNPSTGMINRLIIALGGEAVYFMAKPGLFKWVYVLSGVWQSTGWGTIIYVAALSGVDKSLVEASRLDGANILQKIWYIHVPVLMPTIITLFILNTGSILSIGFEKIYLMQNSINTPVSEVISTYVYKIGVLQFNYSYSTAVGLFNSVVNLVMLLIVNTLSDRVSKVSVL